MRIFKAFLNLRRAREIAEARRVTPDWLGLTARYVGLNRGRPLRVRLRSGGAVTLENGLDAATLWLIFVSKTYPVPAAARTIVDIGGNLGFFTLYALAQAPRSHVTTLEPAPDSFARIQAAVDLLSMPDRTTLLQCAFGDKPGVTHIDLRAPSQFRTTGETGTEVRVMSLAELVERVGEVDFLKLDAEGAEYPGLLSADAGALSRVREIALEFHPNGPGFEALRRHLVANGFAVRYVRDDGSGYGMARFTRAMAGAA